MFKILIKNYQNIFINIFKIFKTCPKPIKPKLTRVEKNKLKTKETTKNKRIEAR